MLSNIIRSCSRINPAYSYPVIKQKSPKWGVISRRFLFNFSATEKNENPEKHESPKASEKHESAPLQSEAEKVNEKEKDVLSQKEILEKNQQLLERLTELDDKYKRSLAENENIRMRMRREISDAKQYGIQNFVRDLLDVADVLNKATESVPKEALNESNSHLKNLFEGLQMTESQLHSVFRRYGVTQVNPLGEKFDPNIHEALFEQDDPSKEPGTVGLVTKVGYKLQDRVIRPALVGVIKSRPVS